MKAACPWSLYEQTKYLFEKFDMILAEGGMQPART